MTIEYQCKYCGIYGSYKDRALEGCKPCQETIDDLHQVLADAGGYTMQEKVRLLLAAVKETVEKGVVK